MTQPNNRPLPPWLWAIVIAALALVAGLLIFHDRREEPSEALRFDVSEYQQVDPAEVLFEEAATLDPGLEKVSALAIAPDGRLFVGGRGGLVVYGADGALIKRIPLETPPDCLAVAADGRLLAGMDDHVEVLDIENGETEAWPPLDEGAYITAIAADGENVYVADAGHRVVLRFDTAGKLLGRIGEEDEAREIPGFIVPSPYFDLALDGQGALWVVNPGRHGLEQYKANGDLVTAWYRASMKPDGFCGCCNPTHIAFRRGGEVITAEKGISRVKMYGPDQAYLGLVAGPDRFGESKDTPLPEEQPPAVADLAVDAQGRVLVLDKRQRILRIFQERASTS